MTAAALSAQYVVFQSACRFAGAQRLYLGKAVLYRSHLRLAGWTHRGRYDRRIRVADIAVVQWKGTPGGPNLILKLHDGEVLSLQVKGAALWRLMLEKQTGPPRLPASTKATYRHHVLYTAGRAPEEAGALLDLPPGDGAPPTSSPAAPRTPGM